MELPAAFEKRMQDMLGAEYTAFRASYNEPHKRGIRLNTVKCTKEQLERALPFTLVQTPFSPLSFYAPTDTKMAALPALSCRRVLFAGAVRVFGRHAFGAGAGG